jgi:hypothetical protein
LGIRIAGIKYGPEVADTLDLFFKEYVAAGLVGELADATAKFVAEGVDNGLLRMVVHAAEVVEDPVRYGLWI